MKRQTYSGNTPSQQAVSKEKQTTRERLYHAAITAFANQGFHGTKVSDIVAEAGVSQPTFYSYFDSKDAAYEALVTQFREGLHEITQRNLLVGHVDGEPFELRVAASFRRFLDYMADDPELTEIGFFQPPSCSVTKEKMVEWVAENIHLEQTEALFRTDMAPTYVARLLVGLLDQMGRLVHDPLKRQERAEVCAKLFCRGACG